MANRVANKKQALLARKEVILKELQYYDKRIDEARNTKQNSSFHENDSSDSEQEFTVEISPSITELKLQQSMLKTCLHATQELTSVQVLQSEVNIMVEEPVIEGEPQITEEGIWKDVTVECRVDLVPFSMSFYAHKPDRNFAPISYRNLQVTAVKAAHERELAKSVLSSVTTPSDAIEVLRSYARAHRSRRASLARLAETYAESLRMEPMAQGGYMLKCANLLEVSWTLQNKWSPIAPFHHKMKFDVEYMDESYIKIITQAHRQLSDPAIDTDERTLLMAKIIKTCLEAEKPTMELHQSFDSDSLKEKRQTLEEAEAPIKSKDTEIMAPPKYPPKKCKAKGKENVSSKEKKRPSNTENEGSIKKARIDTREDDKNDNIKATSAKNKVNNNKDINDNSKTQKSTSQVDKSHNHNDNTSKSSSTNNKEVNDNNAKAKKSNSQVDTFNDNTSKIISTNSKVTKDNGKAKKSKTQIDKLNDKIDDTSKSTSTNNKDVNDPKTSMSNVRNNDLKSTTKTNKDVKIVTDQKKSNTNVASSNNDSKNNLEKNDSTKVKKVAITKNTELKKKETTPRLKAANIDNNPNSFDKVKSKSKDTDDRTKKAKNIDKNSDKHFKNPKTVTTNTTRKNITTNKADLKSNDDKIILNQKKTSQQTNLAERFSKNKTTSNKTIEKQRHLLKSTNDFKKNKISIINGQKNSISKVSKNIKTSKIPQKRLSSESVKMNPLRISPRKPQSNSNSIQDSSKSSVRSMQKVITNIPRLLKKPTTKPKTIV